MVVFQQSGCVREKEVVFLQGGFIWAKRLYSDKSGCFRAKVVVLRQNGRISVKVVVFG